MPHAILKTEFLTTGGGPSIFIRVLAIVLILCVPLAITMAVFKPLATRHQKKDKYAIYALPAHFEKKDLDKVIGLMQQDAEFAFYFQALTQENVKAVVEGVYAAIDQNRSKDQYRKLIQETQEHVKSFTAFFRSLNFEDQFFRSPGDYPELNRALWLFVYEEFKLVLLGLSFRASYDSTFSFTWDDETHQAAAAARRVTERLHKTNAWPPQFDPAIAEKTSWAPQVK